MSSFAIRTAHTAPVSAVALSRSGTVFSVAYDGCLMAARWEGGRLEVQQLLALHRKGVNCLALDPAERHLLTGGSDSAACLVDLRTWKTVRLEHPGDVECAVFSADGTCVMTGGTNQEARLWDTARGTLLATLQHPRTVGAACTHQGLLITGCNDCGLRVFDWAGRLLAGGRAAGGPVKAVVSTRQGLVLGSHDGTLRLSDPSLEQLHVFARLSTTPKSLATDSDGTSVWVGCYDQSLSRYRPVAEGTSRPEARLFLARSWAHGLAVAGDRVAVGSFDGLPLLLDVSGPEPRLLNRQRSPVPCISALAVVPTSGRLLVAGDSGSLRERFLHGDGTEGELYQAGAALTSIQAVGDTVLAGTWDGAVFRLRGRDRLWVARWPGARAGCPVLRVDGDERRVLAGLYTGGAACFDARTGRLLWRQTEATGAIKCVSQADPFFAMTGRYDPLRVGWAATGAILARLELGTPVSDVVAFSPFPREGTPYRLAVTASDNEVWLVDLHAGPGELMLKVVHRGSGHDLPIKAIAWIDPETVMAGDYAGRLVRHRVGEPSQVVTDLRCRLGVSGLAVTGSRLFWSTFDGATGTMELS
jgi:WD40 repeat protein